MIDPKTVCLPHMPIVEAMRRLNAMTPPQYVLVVDEAGRLCGTITDGDVGRAILRGVDLSLNYHADQTFQFFHQHQPAEAEIRFLREEMRMGTAGALSLLPARPTGAILVANADLVTEIDFEALLQFHFEHDYHATVGVAIHVVDIPYGIIECDERGLIQAIREKPRLDYFVNAGLYVLMPEVWNLIPARTFIDMPEVLNRAIEKGLQVGAFPIHEYWVDVGRNHDLAQAQRDWSDEWPEG